MEEVIKNPAPSLTLVADPPLVIGEHPDPHKAMQPKGKSTLPSLEFEPPTVPKVFLKGNTSRSQSRVVRRLVAAHTGVPN